MYRRLLPPLLGLLFLPAANAIDYEKLYDSVDKEKATNSVDKEKMGGSGQCRGCRLQEGI